jgi:hypothetical protein
LRRGLGLGEIDRAAGKGSVQEEETGWRRGMTGGAGVSAGEREVWRAGPGCQRAKDIGGVLLRGPGWYWAEAEMDSGPNRFPLPLFFFSLFLFPFLFSGIWFISYLLQN